MGLLVYKWLKRPTWFDFVLIVLLWFFFFASIVTLCVSNGVSWFYVAVLSLLFLLIYILIVVSAYRHVKHFRKENIK